MDVVDTLVRDERVQRAIQDLPAYLGDRYGKRQTLQAELEELEEIAGKDRGFLGLGIGRKMPKVQRERIKELRGQLSALERIARILILGYEPYAVPDGWYVGWTEQTFEI